MTMPKATKQNFAAILRREFSQYTWAQNPEKMATVMLEVEATLNSKRTCQIDSVSWVKAWRELGLKGKPTYKGLHALPQ